jgi:hypothetical protein
MAALYPRYLEWLANNCHASRAERLQWAAVVMWAIPGLTKLRFGGGNRTLGGKVSAERGEYDAT